MFSILKSLFQRRTAGSKRSARTVPSRNKSRRAFLSVEALEDRCVPATLAVTSTLRELTGGRCFLARQGPLHVSRENLSTGAFDGTFADAKSGICVPVQGQLLPGNVGDAMEFCGVAQKGLETEQVAFTGRFEPSMMIVIPNQMVGTLTETYTFPTHVSHTSTHVDAAVGDELVFSAPKPLPTLPLPIAAPSMSLAGNGSGALSFSRVSLLGPADQLQGQADLSGLGQVTVTGEVFAPFSLFGRAGGTLTFTNAHGSVTVQLEGPSEALKLYHLDGKHVEHPVTSLPLPNDQDLPSQYTYKVTGGTGAYQNFHGQGTLTLTLKVNFKENVGDLTGHGTFSLHVS